MTSSSVTEDDFVLGEEVEEEPDFVVNIDLDDHQLYLDEIRKFKRIIHKGHLDIKPSWSGMNIQETSKEQLEMYIEGNRIQTIMTMTLKKMRLVGSIHHLMKNKGFVLKKLMPESRVAFLEKVRSRINSDLGVSKQSSHRTYKTMVDTYIDPDLEEVLADLTATYQRCISKYVEEAQPEMDPVVRDLHKAIAQLSDVVNCKLTLTAGSERQRESDLKSALRNYKEVIANIKRLQEKLDQQREETNIKLQTKDVIIQSYKQKIENVRSDFKAKIDSIVQQSEKTMMAESDRSETLQAELSEEAKNAQVKYQALLDKHLLEEKLLRGRKFKIEAQLAGWLAKYDQDIGEKQAEYDEEMDGFDAELAEMNELDQKMADHDDVYQLYMDEKEEEDEEIFQDALFNFMRKRAARVIQYAFWAWKARKLARKKAKKDKAKAKAEKKAAQKAAKGKK